MASVTVLVSVLDVLDVKLPVLLLWVALLLVVVCVEELEVKDVVWLVVRVEVVAVVVVVVMQQGS